MTFAICGPESDLTKALVLAFSKISKTGFFTDVSQTQARNAANVIVVGTFHRAERIDLNIVVFENEKEIILKPSTYFVRKDSNPLEAAEIIVKRYLGFESRKATVIKVSSKEVIKEDGARRKKVILFRKPKLGIFKYVKIVAVLAIWVLALPYFALLISGVCSYIAFRSFVFSGNMFTKGLLNCSVASASASTSLGGMFLNTPVLGKVYKPQVEFSQFMTGTTKQVREVYYVYKSLSNAPSLLTINLLAPSISKISREALALLSDTKQIRIVNNYFPQISSFLDGVVFLNVLSAMGERSDILLGGERSMTYLVLLQNNMELRATGGFVGSFLLLTIDRGEVTAKKIYDVYDADGQIDGYVKPPEAISKYLGEASWHMRDSNWDPDFPTSAKRAEWFIEKALNIQVDGVIGVDLEVLRGLISVIGPISVPDYGGELTADDFYQTIQSEVHKEFFPGSRKKSNYLTAVFNAVLQKLEVEGRKHASGLLLSMLSSFKARDIQVYANDPSTQLAFSKAGIAGEVLAGSVGFVESNLGVNKANQYIERLGGVEVKKKEGGIELRQKLEILNTATNKTDETRYRVYLRSFVPKGGLLKYMKVMVHGSQIAVIPEKETTFNREEAGVFFEVDGGEKAIVEVEWEISSFPNLIFRKQAGVSSYPLVVVSLTGEGERRYNTTLTKDIKI